MKAKISLKRLFFVLVVFVISAIGSYCLTDEIRASEKPAEYIAVVFSILAASLFAVISIVGDPGMLAPGPARSAWTNARSIQLELHRFNLLFFWYLLTLGLLIAAELVEHASWENFYWIGNLFTFFAISGFLFSLALPCEFTKLQKRRLEQEIAARSKRNHGRQDHPRQH